MPSASWGPCAEAAFANAAAVLVCFAIVPSAPWGACAVGQLFCYAGGELKEKAPSMFVAHSIRLSGPVRVFQVLGEVVGVGV